jgi:hypothetical protein
MSTYNFPTQKEFIEAYRKIYEEIGSYRVYELEKREIMKLLGRDFIDYGMFWS